MAKLKAGGDLQEPWKRSWIPLLENGGGDYIVWDAKIGRVIQYWHDDPAREVYAKGLEEWVAGFIPAYEEQKRAHLPRQIAWRPETARPLDRALRVDRAPLGTVIYGGPARLLPHIKGSPREHIVMLRAHSRGTWVIARDATLEKAFAKVAEKLAITGDPHQYHFDSGAASFLQHLLDDPKGAPTAMQAEAEVTVVEGKAKAKEKVKPKGKSRSKTIG